jgi:TIR domain/HEAT repeats/NACHT domain
VTEAFSFDLFLSHSSKDNAVVRPLAERLRADGLKVWFDEWVLKPGDSIPAKIEEGLEHSRVLVLCMSAQAFGSDWAQLEAGTFRFRDPLNRERRFIPLRLDDAPIKGSLAQFLYINWCPAGREQEYAKLRDSCHHQQALASPEQRQDEFPVIRPYLEEVAAEKPYQLTNHEDFVERMVAASGGVLADRRERPTKTETLGQFLEREPKVVLLGEPGAGKTTCLLHLAWRAAYRALKEPEVGEIPFYVALKEYQGQADLNTLVARNINRILSSRRMELASDRSQSLTVLKELLSRSSLKFLFLLDGMNEVAPEFYMALRAALIDLLSSPHRIVISCRERDYDASLRGAAPVRLMGLNARDIYHYLAHELRGEGTSIFHGQIESDEQMLSLASNPLMLWMITELARDDKNTRLEANHGRLFRQFVKYMPRLRRAEGVRSEVPFDLVSRTLANIGFEMKERGRLTAELGEIREWGIVTPNQPLEKVLTEGKEWRFLKSHGVADDPLEFLHPLFLEYFAAVHLESELRRQNPESVLRARVLSGAWDEVIVMLTGICENPMDVSRWLLNLARAGTRKRPALIACQCWKTIPEIKQRVKRSSVEGALIDALHDSDANVRSLAAAECGYPFESLGVVKALIGLLIDADEQVREKAVTGIGSAAKAIGTKPLISMLGDPSATVRASAAWALGSIGQRSAVKPLIAALHDPVAEVRENVAGALGQVGDPAAIKSLSAALKDTDAGVRREAAVSLGQTFDARAIKPLAGALKDTDPSVRKEAVEALAAPGLPKAVAPLLSALRDSDSDVRWSAVHALGELGDESALLELDRLSREDSGETSFVMVSMGPVKDEPYWGGKISDAAAKAAKLVRERLSSANV